MSRVARYGKAVAREGCGEELARLLVAVAGTFADDPGCVLYLINRQKTAPDIIWITELWRSQAELDTSIAKIGGSADAVMALVDDWEMIELELLGGKG
jgi:quinol monooxygenase YgiN